MSIFCLEDFTPGQRLTGHTSIRIEEDRIKTFASEFDPQSLHLDEVTAKVSIFGGLVASGWHTASVTMRLVVDSEFKPAGGMIAAGFDELHLPCPVRPGDELRVETEVLDVGPSKPRPEQGLIKVRTSTPESRRSCRTGLRGQSCRAATREISA